jgi:AraC-like DNA-binding protein
MKEIQDGFIGQRFIVVPETVISLFKKNPLFSNLYLTDIGHFPQAVGHFRKRTEGIDQNILIFCHKGEGTVTIHNKKHSITAGDFFVIPENTAHSYQSSTDNEWTIYWFHFSGLNCNYFFQQENLQIVIQKLHRKNILIFIDIFDHMYLLLEQGYSIKNMLLVSALLSELLTHIFFSDTAIIPNKKSVLVDESISYMKAQLHRQLDLSELSDHVNLSPSHFLTIFRSETGFPPITYYHHLKIQKACLLLETTCKSIKEIAFQLGFSDVYYFSRQFKLIMGKSPSDFRKSNH